jgi:hypothetical protein
MDDNAPGIPMRVAVFTLAVLAMLIPSPALSERDAGCPSGIPFSVCAQDCPQGPPTMGGLVVGDIEPGGPGVRFKVEWYFYDAPPPPPPPIALDDVTFSFASVGLSEVWFGAYLPDDFFPGTCFWVIPTDCPLDVACNFLLTAANVHVATYPDRDYFLAVTSLDNGLQSQTISEYVIYTGDVPSVPHIELCPTKADMQQHLMC